MVFLSETIDMVTEAISASQYTDTLFPFGLDLIVNLLSILGYFITVSIAIWGAWKQLINPYFSFKRFVTRVYSLENLIEVTRYYIPTRAQDVDPCEQEELKDNEGNFIAPSLVKFFINDAFRSASSGKFYLVLADSGMGKTTFLLRLYRQCLLPFQLPKHMKAHLIPLTDPLCLKRISEIPEPENTILLLDALDENKLAINDCESFLEELVNSSLGFYKVVITCRTQFFPNKKKETSAIKYINIGGQNKKAPVIQKYLSPFTDDEVRKYLKKRFRFNYIEQKRALNIVRKVPNIMARPLILNWINFLCDSDEDYRYSFQIYSEIIDQWIAREETYLSKDKLFELSRVITDYMFLHESITIPAKKVEDIASKKGINIEPIIAKSRSLLNRNGRGEYKFAHRSFLEYFIVVGIFEKMQMPANTDFLWSLSGAKRFLLEILLASAESTNFESLMQAESEFGEYKKYTGSDHIVDFVLSQDTIINHVNDGLGFIIEAHKSYVDRSSYKLSEILKMSETIPSTEGAIYQAIVAERHIDIGVSFRTISGEMPPYTSVEIVINKSQLTTNVLS